MKIDVHKAKWNMDNEGTWLCLLCRHKEAESVVQDINSTDKPYVADIKVKRNRRSLNSNDYLWVLCSKISEEMAREGCYESKEDIYREAIKVCGVHDYVAVTDKAVDRFIQEWNAKGIGWFAEKIDSCKIDNCSKVIVYYGSSTYDSAEMSRVIDYIVQECKNLDIETLSPEEISRMNEAWGR